ncbi:MAG: transposase, partial [Pseudomonadota bacterium]
PPPTFTLFPYPTLFLSPPGFASKPGGRPQRSCPRRVVDAILHLLQTGYQWRMLPHDVPPRSTVCGYSRAWRDDVTSASIHDALYRRCRDLEGREESRSAAIIDSQSVKTGSDARNAVGFCAGRRIKGHPLCDTLGLMMRMEVHSADAQDRDGAALVFDFIAPRFPFVER